MEIGIGKYTLILKLAPENLGMLFFLIAITTVAYYYMRKLRKERTIKLGNFKTLKEVHGRKSIASPSILLVKIVTVVMLFMVATGSIQIMSEQPVSNTDFVVAIDNSQSMLTPDYPPNRLAYAKDTVSKWVSKLPGRSNISVISFSGKPKPVETPTDRKEDALKAISSISPDLDSTGTAIGDAISMGVTILSDSIEERKSILIVTDGKNNVGENVSEVLDRAKKENVTVNIIGISSTDRTQSIYRNLSKSIENTSYKGEIQPPDIDSQNLKSYAQETGGKFFEITNKSFFDNSLKEIVLKQEKVALDSNYYILIFISLLIISEMFLYSKFGAI